MKSHYRQIAATARDNPQFATSKIPSLVPTRHIEEFQKNFTFELNA